MKIINKIMKDSSKRIKYMALLFLMSAIVSGSFRWASSVGMDATYLVCSFSKTSELNSETHYRYSAHGYIQSIKKEIYDNNILWAIITFIFQLGIWMCAGTIYLFYGIPKESTNWKYG